MKRSSDFPSVFASNAHIIFVRLFFFRGCKNEIFWNDEEERCLLDITPPDKLLIFFLLLIVFRWRFNSEVTFLN